MKYFIFIAFDGTGEVTVNIFTLHAMDVLCHNPVWIHNWLKCQISDTQKYISNGSKFDEWKSKPGVALFIYAQLAREYGWYNYNAVFRKYEELNPQLNSNQEKIDYWIMTFSRQVGHNLIPLFKFWGFPVSESTIDSLSDLQIPSITDEFIQLAPERYKIE
jgi:alpha-L-fucosidase